MDTSDAALTAWIAFHAGIGVELESLFLPGATDTELDRVEAEIGVALPDDLRALYRRANGQLDRYGDDDWPDPTLRDASMFGYHRGADYGDVRVLASSVTQLMSDAAQGLDPDEAWRFTYEEASPAQGDMLAVPSSVQFEIDLREPVYEPTVPTARDVAENEAWHQRQDEERNALLSWLTDRGLDEDERLSTLDTFGGMILRHAIPPHPMEPVETGEADRFESYLVDIFAGMTMIGMARPEEVEEVEEAQGRAALTLFHAYQLERGAWTPEQRARADRVLGRAHPAANGTSEFDFDIRAPDGSWGFGGRILNDSDLR